jgi:hypothetical protein
MEDALYGQASPHAFLKQLSACLQNLQSTFLTPFFRCMHIQHSEVSDILSWPCVSLATMGCCFFETQLSCEIGGDECKGELNVLEGGIRDLRQPSWTSERRSVL